MENMHLYSIIFYLLIDAVYMLIKLQFSVLNLAKSFLAKDILLETKNNRKVYFYYFERVTKTIYWGNTSEAFKYKLVTHSRFAPACFRNHRWLTYEDFFWARNLREPTQNTSLKFYHDRIHEIFIEITVNQFLINR